jgi:ankyrin repeat protein
VTSFEILDSNSPDVKDSYGRTPLSWAAENGHETVVKLLANDGIDPDSKDIYSRTPLS